MNCKESVYSILIVSAADRFNASLRELLDGYRFSPVCFENSVSGARRVLLEREFDFIWINSPLPDDTGLRFAIDACHEKSNIALLFVRAELYTATYSKVAEHGVYVLAKPTSRAAVLQAADWMIATRERLKKFEKKTMSIDEKMQEIRLINRAKCLLIEQLKMTEAEAHRYIEKRAMDSCTPKKAIAQDIIRTYA